MAAGMRDTMRLAAAACPAVADGAPDLAIPPGGADMRANADRPPTATAAIAVRETGALEFRLRTAPFPGRDRVESADSEEAGLAPPPFPRRARWGHGWVRLLARGVFPVRLPGGVFTPVALCLGSRRLGRTSHSGGAASVSHRTSVRPVHVTSTTAVKCLGRASVATRFLCGSRPVNLRARRRQEPTGRPVPRSEPRRTRPRHLLGRTSSAHEIRSR